MKGRWYNIFRRYAVKRIIVIVVIALWVSLPPIGCQAAETTDHICFRVLDSDHDGSVTPQEFAKFFPNDAERFNAADVNKDGKLTHDEYHDLLGHGSTQ